MDSLAEVKYNVFQRLTSDSELQTLMGGTVRLFDTWAAPDSELPYMVYRFMNVVPRQTYDVVGMATLITDLWDYNPTSERLYDIRERVCKLLEGSTWLPSGVRLRKALEIDITEDTRYIWHRSIDWSVRYVRREEISATS